MKEPRAKVAPTAETLVYDRLFSIAPGVRPLFLDDITEQKRKLKEMITAVVDGLDRPYTIVGEVEDLGRRHEAYGAAGALRHRRREPAVDARQGLGEDFIPAVKEAWTAAYGLLATR